jgi:enoyl-CoA hydratase/3-hydroxyacyl-CoA dehydrogenase
MAADSFDSYQKFYRYVLVDDVDDVKVITIRRPQAMNALNDDVTAEILDVLQQFENDPAVKGFVITGYGSSAFSAGADIGRFPSMLGDKAASIQYARDCANVQRFMDKMDKPVVAALNGLAMGGGLEVAIRCHGIVSVGKAILQFPEITLGILPGIGGCVVPYRKWPQASELFNKMILFAKPVTAEIAADVGIVDQVVSDPAELLSAALDLVERLQENLPRINEAAIELPDISIPESPQAGKQPLSREAVMITADAVRKAAAAEGLDEALELGYAGFGEIACSDAAKEGISAFLQRRKPNFK